MRTSIDVFDPFSGAFFHLVDCSHMHRPMLGLMGFAEAAPTVPSSEGQVCEGIGLRKREREKKEIRNRFLPSTQFLPSPPSSLSSLLPSQRLSELRFHPFLTNMGEELDDVGDLRGHYILDIVKGDIFEFTLNR